ncbi:MAG: DUF2520 domain-containing protein [Bacteroidetes bacterium]|nr:MAG: DUF2520 domain-containing protein [Bacteroidota bacterium]UCE70244.1 MAG: DUF2520 domain-containing protein [Flavobacteriaceae bacterium]
MIRVVLLGSGNVAYHLHRALHRSKGIELKQVIARRKEALSDFVPPVPFGIPGGPVAEADIYMIAVADGAIEAVAGLLGGKAGLVVHTSGARDLQALKGVSRPGVFYPLQTFSRLRELDFEDIPLCIETGRPEDLPLLRSLANALSKQVVELDLASRRRLHLAAVFVNNFSNHMVYLGEALCREAELPENLLRPLLRETYSKLETLTAYQSQTGPARRGDQITQEAHLDQLKDSLRRQLYQMISESIHQTYD